MELKLFSLAFWSNCWRISDEILAFVKIKPNIVAILGAIMPDPLAIPIISTSTSSIKHFRDEIFEKVSVVLMVSAAFSQFVS